MADRKYYSEEAKRQAQMETAMIATVLLALGVGIGTVLAILFAPQSGNETRHDLSDATGDAVKNLEKKFNDLRKDVEKRIAS